MAFVSSASACVAGEMGCPPLRRRGVSGPVTQRIFTTACGQKCPRPRSSSARTITTCSRRSSLPPLGFLACRIELLEIRDEVVDALFVFQSGKDHLSARHLCFRIPYVFAEGRLIPRYA